MHYIMKNLLVSNSTGNNTLDSMLCLLNIKHTKSYTDKHFNEHPNKYNMLGLSEMFSHYNIESLGIMIANKEDLLTLEPPFVAHIGGDFVTINKVTKEHVSCIWNGKRITTSLTEFIKSWSGVTLLVETNEQSIEPNYQENRKKELLERAFNFF